MGIKMNDGYCLAYRSAWSNPIFRDLLEAGVWNWIYQSCAWKETTVRVNGCMFELKRGELVTTISFISQGFRISPQSTRTLIKNLEKSGMINIRTNKQATIISVCNYDKFQDLNYTGNKRTNKRVTNDQQTPNNNKNTINTYNTINTIIGDDVPSCIPSDEWEMYKKHRGGKFTEKAQELAINKLEKWHNEGYDIKAILENSVMNDWKGLFLPKDNQKQKGNINGKSKLKSEADELLEQIRAGKYS